MPHEALKLIPGADQNRTEALNTAALSETNLIRFIPDRGGLGLVQKLGGWVKFYANSVGSIVRALLGWEDTNSISRLAVGAEHMLGVVEDNNLIDITPQTTEENLVVSFSTTSGSSVVLIDAVGSGLDQYDSVHLKTQVSVGGLILFGVYRVSPISADIFSINASNVTGFPSYATSTVSAAGDVPVFTSTAGSAVISVELSNHGLSVGSTFPILIETNVGSVILYGNFIVQSVVDANNFTITGPNEASSSATVSENSGLANFVYYNGIGPPLPGAGFGVGGFGVGGFGSGISPSSSSGTPISASNWTLDNWGEILIACPLMGPIYQWNPSDNNPVGTIIPEAPVANNGVLVAMPQRQIFAWGSTDNGIVDPLLIKYCDVNNFYQWIARTGNQAGKYRISKGSKIVQCIQGPQQIFIWTDIGLWSAQYIGPPYVYSFNEIGTGCGLIGPKAAASMAGTIYWMGKSQFFIYSGQGVQSLPCPIWDVIFQELDLDNTDRIIAAPNSMFGEMTWYFPVNGSGGENFKYVKVNTLIQPFAWDFGELSRTAWINESVLGPPIGASNGQLLLQHEKSPDADGQAMLSSFQTGYFSLAEGDALTFLDQLWPDMKWGYYGSSENAEISITIYATDYPGDTPRVYGPFTVTKQKKFITPRVRGRLVSLKIESSDVGTFWRLGNIRYRLQPDGRF